MPKKAKPEAASIFVPEAEQPYQIPDNWRWARIGAVADLYTGNSINEKVKKQKYEGNPEGYLYIATKDIGFDGVINYETNIRIPERDSFKVAPANTALLCVEGGSAGRKIGFVNQAVCFVNKLCAFRTSTVHSKYVFYFLQTHCFESQFLAKKHGLIGGVPIKALSTSIIPIAPLAEQQRIVDRIESLFSKLDEARDKAREVVEGFELRKAAILYRAFSGELTAKWRISHCIHDTWTHQQLSDLGRLERGRSKHRPRNDPKLFGGSYPFIQTGDIATARKYIISHKQTLSEEGLQQSRMFPAGTLCITIAANIGDVAILSYDCCFPDSVVGFTPFDTVIPEFVYYKMCAIQQELELNAPATAQKNINLKVLNSIEVLLPQMEEQKEIVRILDDFFEKEQQANDLAEATINQIDTMKKAILGRAFRGELGTNDPSEASPETLLRDLP